MNPVWDFVTGLVKPITDLIGKAVLDKDKQLEAQSALAALQYNMAGKMMDYESSLLSAQSQAILGEEKGDSWLQRNWRPIMMLTFLVLVVLDSFKMLKEPLAPQMWVLLQIGLGGYLAGHTIEKATPIVMRGIQNMSNGNDGTK